MQVNAVTKQTSGNQAFGRRVPTRDDLEQFAAADDRVLKNFAMQTASESVDDKKHRFLSNTIWYSLPIAAGLASIVRNPNVIGRIPKLKIFAKTAASWAGAFALIDATFAAKRAIDNNSSTAREFAKEHPVLSTITAVGAAIGAMILGSKGASALWNKYGAQAVQYLKKHGVDKAINDSKLITNVMANVRKLPSAIKNFTKGLIDWSPTLLIFTSLAHTFSHERAKTAEIAKNYTLLKTQQAQIRAALEADAE